MKKKWFDLKASTKKHFAAIKESREQKTQPQPEPLMTLTDLEERVLAITSPDQVPHGGGDMEQAPLSDTDAGKY